MKYVTKLIADLGTLIVILTGFIKDKIITNVTDVKKHLATLVTSRDTDAEIITNQFKSRQTCLHPILNGLCSLNLCNKNLKKLKLLDFRIFFK